MRIERISLSNLNSLAGGWEIDLTRPEYAADGLFAITGPTGSGKTTILDAVCLALYGRTPRLEKVNSSDNEIMSRSAGSCEAKVIFRTAEGAWLCEWSQRRARGKAGGNLQSVRHAIASLPDGTYLANTVTATPAEVERITGLGFDRFTRSMMLAQGRFAAFLEASEESRSDILEQITGTEIYTRIDQKCHELWSGARRGLELLDAGLKGLTPMEADEEARLGELLSQLESRRLTLDKELESDKKALAWLERLSALKKELEGLAAEEGELGERAADFRAQEERLALALKAVELTADYSEVTGLRTRGKKLDEDSSAAKATRPGLLAAAESASASREAARAAAEAAGQRLERAGPFLAKARELDLMISESAKAIRTAEARLSKAEGLSDSNAKTSEAKKADLKNLAVQAGELRDHLDRASADEALAERLPAWTERAAGLKRAKSEAARKAGEVSTMEAAAAASKAEIERVGDLLTKAQDQLERGQGETRKLEADLAAALAGRSLEDARASLDGLRSEREALATAGRLRAEIDRDLAEVAALERGSERLSASLIELELKLGGTEKERGRLEQVLSELSEESRRESLYASLEDRRAALVDGEPCPLCGSIHHPFREAVPAPPRATGKALKEAEAALKKADKDLETLKVGRAVIVKDQERNDSELEKLNLRLPASEAELAELWAGTGRPPLPQGEEAGRLLASLAIETSAAFEKAGKALAGAERLERNLAKSRESLSKLAEAKAERQRALHGLEARLEADEGHLRKARRESDDLNARLSEDEAALAAELAAFGERGELQAALKNLTARRDGRARGLERLAAADKKIATLEAELAQLVERQGVLAEDVQAAKEALDGLTARDGELRKERTATLGERDPEAVERGLKKAIADADQALEAARNSEAERAAELERLKSRIESLEKDLESVQNDLAAAEPALSAKLAERGFSSEEAYLAAVLPEAERAKIARDAQELAKERAALSGLLKERTKALNDTEALSLTSRPDEELRESIAALTRSSQEALEESGRARGRLHDNEELKKKRGAALAERAAAQADYERIDRLHQLVGSSEGKKYRNFVQTLTFESLVKQANLQLMSMSERYLLFHDPEKRLKVSVIDGFQGSEIRPVKNLSGGETFIVSLALALGLSRLAGENVRVDSLFLDEGFGTLDEDALDLALDTLQSLRREGKTIGLISHVPALTERIAATIKVKPVAPGRSVIEGPGCRPLS